jgi:hypothetical protein
VLTLLGRLLGQGMVLGFAIPLGQVFEVWNHCFVKVEPGSSGQSPMNDRDTLSSRKAARE